MSTILITGASGGLAQEMVNSCPMINWFCWIEIEKKWLNYTEIVYAELVEIDITDSQALEGLVAELHQHLWKDWCLINNAGYGILRISIRFLIKIFISVWG